MEVRTLMSATTAGTPEVTGPASAIATTIPTIKWTAAANAKSYELWVDQIGDTKQIIRQTINGSTSFTPSTALPVGQYRVWVQAIDAQGKRSSRSAPADFSVMPAAQLRGTKLMVNGTDNADTISVSQGRNLEVNVNGINFIFTPSQVTDILIQGHGGNDKIAVNSFGRNKKLLIDGGDGDDILTVAASVQADTQINGGAGKDRLTGGSGIDRLTGGDGNDVLIGGRGDDYYFFGDTGVSELDTIVELTGGGTDTLSFLAMTSDITVDLSRDDLLATMRNRRIRTSAAGQAANLENVTGGGGDDRIKGNSAANLLAGSRGSDRLAGGKGDDRYYFNMTLNNEIDTVIELANEGSDRLDFSGMPTTVTADLNSEQAVATMLNRTVKTGGSRQSLNIENLTGGSGDDKLFGNILPNQIDGRAGNDKIDGRGGDDLLVGGDGSDTINGGPGFDQFAVRLPGAKIADESASHSQVGFIGKQTLTAVIKNEADTDQIVFTRTGLNEAPRVEGIGTQTIAHGGDTLSLPLRATDTDGDTVTSTVRILGPASADPRVSALIANGTLIISTDSTYSGVFSIEVSGTDGYGSTTVVSEVRVEAPAAQSMPVLPDALQVGGGLGLAGEAIEQCFGGQYQALRERYLRGFFFDGMSAESVTTTDRTDTFAGADAKSVKFADQTVYMGFSLLTFAGEARLLRASGSDSAAAEVVIRSILLGFERLEENGFFFRDIATNANVSGHQPGGSWSLAESDFTSANGTDKAMSVDQTIHMFMGWWAVARWSTNAENVALAKAQLTRVMDFLMRSGYTISMPDGGLISEERGRDFRPAAGFLSEIASQVTGHNYLLDPRNVIKVEIQGREILGAITGGISAAVEEAKRLLTQRGFGDTGTLSIHIPVAVTHPLVVNSLGALDSALRVDVSLNDYLPGWLKDLSVTYPTTQATRWSVNTPWGEVWTEGFEVVLQSKSVGDMLEHVRVRIGDKVSSYVRQLILVSAAFSEAPEVNQHFESIARLSNNPWAVMLRSAVKGVFPAEEFSAWARRVAAQLPQAGPNGDAGVEWSSDNRWVRCTTARDAHGNADCQFNGLDYMSLEVLMRISDNEAFERASGAMRAVLGDVDLNATVNGQAAYYGHWLNTYTNDVKNGLSDSDLRTRILRDHRQVAVPHTMRSILGDDIDFEANNAYLGHWRNRYIAGIDGMTFAELQNAIHNDILVGIIANRQAFELASSAMRDVLGDVDLDATVNGQAAYYGHWLNTYTNDVKNGLSDSDLRTRILRDHRQVAVQHTMRSILGDDIDFEANNAYLGHWRNRYIAGIDGMTYAELQNAIHNDILVGIIANRQAFELASGAMRDVLGDVDLDATVNGQAAYYGHWLNTYVADARNGATPEALRTAMMRDHRELAVPRAMKVVLGANIDFEADNAFLGHWRNRYMDHASNVSYSDLIAAISRDIGSVRGFAQAGTVSLRTTSGHYLVAEDGGGGAMNANRTAVGSWERFFIVSLGGDRVALRSANGKYVVAENAGGGAVNANRDAIGAFETFTVVGLGGNQIALRTVDGHFLCAEGGGGGELVANRTAIGAYETFTFSRA